MRRKSPLCSLQKSVVLLTLLIEVELSVYEVARGVFLQAAAAEQPSYHQDALLSGFLIQRGLS